MLDKKYYHNNVLILTISLMRNNWLQALAGFGEVFAKPLYLFLALLVALTVFFASMWLNNYQFLYQVLFSGSYKLVAKLKILLSSFEVLLTNYDTKGQILIISLSLMVGINITLQIYYFYQRSVLQKTVGGSLFGLVVGFLGVGCASCGSILITSIFGLSASASFLGFLPFGGLELGGLGLAVLIFSSYLVAKKIKSPLIC